MASEPTSVEWSPYDRPERSPPPDDQRASGIDRRAVVLALAAAAGVCLAVWVLSSLLAPRFILIDEAVLRGENGVVDENTLLAPAERLRLELRLHRPAAVLVLLIEPRGEVLDVYPAPGGVPLLEAGEHRLPPGGGAWESAGLEQGQHCLWLLAGGDAVSEDERHEVVQRFRTIIQASLRNRRLSWEEVEEAAARSGMEFLPFSFRVDRAR